MDLKIVYRKSVLSVLIFWFITSFKHVSCKTCTNPLDVMSCPKSAYLWRERSSIICVEEDEYHCLGTGTGTVIECCMTAHEISAGHFPRFNKLKMEIQEIECDKDHFMPVSLPSNKWLDNGPMHCKYQKRKCNLEGMKVCTDGSTTEDRKCKCDYMNNYKPDEPGDICFKQDDNRCSIASFCMNSDKELNMRYECVNICSVGYYRPEGEMNCIPKPTTVVMPTEISTSIENEITTIGIGVATDEIKPISDNSFDKTLIVILVISVVVVAFFFILSKLLVFIYRGRRRNEKGKSDGNDEEMQEFSTPLVPLVKLEKPHYVEDFGADVSIAFEIINRPEDNEIIWKKGKNKSQIFDQIDFSTQQEKYTITNSNLMIQHADFNDAGFYACFVKCQMNESEAIFPPEPNENNITHVEIKKPKVEIEKPAYNVKYGDPFTIVCKIENVRDYKVIWKKGKSSNNWDEVINVEENLAKYEVESKDFPHLTVNNARKADAGFYACFIEYSVNGRTVVFPTEDDNGKNICRIHVNRRKKTKVTNKIKTQNVVNVDKAKKIRVAQTSNGMENNDESEDSGEDSTDSQESDDSGSGNQDNL